MNLWLALYLIGSALLGGLVLGCKVGADDDIKPATLLALAWVCAIWPIFTLWGLIQSIGRERT